MIPIRPHRSRWRVTLRCSCGAIVGGATAKTRNAALTRYERNLPVTNRRAHDHLGRRRRRHRLERIIRGAVECRICGYRTPWVLYDEDTEITAMQLFNGHDCSAHMAAVLALEEQPGGGLDERYDP